MKHNILLLSCALLIGCSNNSTFKENKQLGDGDKVLYEEAISDINSNNKAAIEKLNIIELNYPKSANLPEAMKLKIYALYNAEDYISASRQAEKFISLYPKHRDTPYAYYIKGMCSQLQIMDSQRDQTMTEEALIAFNALEKQFPNSSYAKFAKDIIYNAENLLAVKQIEIGRSYGAKGQYGASVDRYQFVLKTYPNSLSAPEALYRMVEVYINLNAQDHAQKYLNKLKINYQDNHWTDKAMQLFIKKYRTNLESDLGQIELSHKKTS